MNIIIIGHVDSGKSTICGNMLVLSGKVDEDELRKYEQEAKEKGRESWIWAYVMDINSEERDKGKTVEVGKAQFDLPNKRYTILDCPGHKNYVPNMISGVAQADVAALVVSAKSGEFEAGFERAGQTREHAILASNMGSGNLIVIVNKMDECEWGKDRFDYIQTNLSPFLQDTCGYDVKNNVTWVPVSGFHGLNINKPIGTEVCPWYKGGTLLDTLDSMPKVDRIQRNCLRIPVFDAFKDQGNLIVFGKIESGIIREGMKLVMMPNSKEFTCTKIIDNEDNEIAMAKSGDNIKVSTNHFISMNLDFDRISPNSCVDVRQGNRNL
jgi:peptide chain release factor subunit 3